jgi:hypothetical protein
MKINWQIFCKNRFLDKKCDWPDPEGPPTKTCREHGSLLQRKEGLAALFSINAVTTD